MKHFLTIIALAITASLAAQTIAVDEIDDFTGERHQITSDFDAGDGLIMNLVKVNDGYFMFIHEANGCVGVKSNEVIFLFDNKTTLSLPDQTAQISCGGRRFYALILPNGFEKRVIKKIRVHGTTAVNDFSVNSEILARAFALFK